MAEFFHMGGYAFFVWTSYAITALVYVWLYFAPKAQHRRLRRELTMELGSEPGHDA